MILTDDERVRLDSLAHRSRTAPPLVAGFPLYQTEVQARNVMLSTC